MDGELIFQNGKSWDSVSLDVEVGLMDLWIEDERSVYCVGDHGEIVHVTFDGSMKMVGQEKFVDPERRRLFAIHGCSKNRIIAVGGLGLLYAYDGKTWREIDSGTNDSLMAVLCVSEKEAYVGGVNGLLFNYDGRELAKIEADEEMTISGLAMYRGDLYVATTKNGVHVVKGGVLEQIKAVPIYRISTIGDYLVGNGERLVAYFNGKEWWGGELEL